MFSRGLCDELMWIHWRLLLECPRHSLSCVKDSERFSDAEIYTAFWASPGGSDSKDSAGNAGDPGSIPGLVRSPEEGNSCPLQYSCLGNLLGRGSWRATVHGGCKQLDMIEQLTLLSWYFFKHLRIESSQSEWFCLGKGWPSYPPVSFQSSESWF